MDRMIEKKRFTKKRMISGAAGLVIIFILLRITLFGDHSSRLNVQEERITIATVVKEPFQEFIPISGTIIPIRTAYLDAQVGGLVNHIFLESGNMVAQGDTILQLENTNLRLDIMNQEASLMNQRNQLENMQLDMEKQRLNLRNQLLDFDYQINQAKRLYEQNKDLLANKIISKREYDESKEAYEYHLKKRELAVATATQDSLSVSLQLRQMKHSLRRLQANQDIVKERIKQLTIQAPVTGQLTSLNVEYIGEIVASGERLGQIDILDGFKIRAGVDEHYLPRINIGQQGTFDFAGQKYALTIQKIFPEIVDGRFNIDLEFVEASPTQMRRGQTVHIRLELGGLDETLTVARGGFYQKTGGHWIFVVDASGQFAVKRDIRLGRQNTEVYEVLSGLEAGERVIVSSYDHFGDVEKLVLK